LFTTKKKLENELETIKDRLLRVNAEYDNFRKRTEKEKKIIYTDACTDVLKNILPVFDNLQRAIVADGSAEDLKKGIESTIRQFEEALTKLGVEEVDTSEGFDPELHEAIMHVEDSNFGQKEIVEVFQKGFKRGDKVLRHSLVKVAN
jgi:molecular chaperone GrpE